MSSSLIVVLQPRHGLDRDGLDYAAFARHYSRYHFCFLFLRVLRCFSSPRSPRNLSGVRPSAGRVAPFGYPRIKSYLPIPAAFRSLSRPSSPPGAKASALRPSLLSFARTSLLAASDNGYLGRKVCGLRSVFSTVFSFFSFLLYPAGSSRVLLHTPSPCGKRASPNPSRAGSALSITSMISFSTS